MVVDVENRMIEVGFRNRKMRFGIRNGRIKADIIIKRM